MATSIGDLLATLDQETARRTQDPRDAARALDRTGRLLRQLRNDGIGADTARIRDDVARRLADECATAAIAFEGGPGRLGDLVSVTGDAIGRLSADLTDSDRWAAAIALAATARRCAAIIAKSGPYTHVPQLLGIADRSRELMRAAAVCPPDPDDLRGHDVPIAAGPPPHGLSPARVAIESMAELIDEFRRQGRDPMNVRQLLGICRAAEQVATQGAAAARQVARGASPRPSTAAPNAWRDAREIVALYADRPRRPGWDGSRVLLAAARLEHSARHMFDGADKPIAYPGLPRAPLVAIAQDIDAVTRLLPRLADHCRIELEQIHATLFIGHGPQPLHEGRVGEWLRHEAFVVRRPDLAPASDALRHAARTSGLLASNIHAAVVSVGRGMYRDQLALPQVAPMR